MKISKLKQYCLQYLEQNDDTKVIDESIEELEQDDNFKEYLYNIEHSIYMGLVRYATSMILPIMEKQITSSIYYLQENGRKIFHKIKEIYALDENGNILSNVKYTIIGSKIIIPNMSGLNKYFVVYYPTIQSLEYYANGGNIDDLELTNIDQKGLCVPDEMAINIKYLVYSDMKIEENPNVANINKNYFENYLAEMQTNQVQNNQVEVITRDYGDAYGDEDIVSSDGANYWLFN